MSAQISPEIVRAFADAMENGFTGSLNQFATSDAGKKAAEALAEKKAADAIKDVMSMVNFVRRDLRVNKKLTTYSGEKAQALLKYLENDVDFANLPAPAAKTTDDATDGDATE